MAKDRSHQSHESTHVSEQAATAASATTEAAAPTHTLDKFGFAVSNRQNARKFVTVPAGQYGNESESPAQEARADFIKKLLLPPYSKPIGEIVKIVNGLQDAGEPPIAYQTVFGIRKQLREKLEKAEASKSPAAAAAE